MTTGQVVDLWLAAVGDEKPGVLDEKISRQRAHDGYPVWGSPRAGRDRAPR